MSSGSDLIDFAYESIEVAGDPASYTTSGGDDDNDNVAHGGPNNVDFRVVDDRDPS